MLMVPLFLVMKLEEGAWSSVTTMEAFNAGACHFFPSVSDPERAELLACRGALELAREMGVDKVALETDC